MGSSESTLGSSSSQNTSSTETETEERSVSFGDKVAAAVVWLTSTETEERLVSFGAKVAAVAATATAVGDAFAALSRSQTDEDNRNAMIATAGRPSEPIFRDDFQRDFQILQLDREAEIWMKHYSSKQKILLVGEGDLSFSLCLARAFVSARNMVATSFNTQEDLASMFKYGMRNVRGLEEKGCLVLYKVDVRKMSQDLFLNTQRFDRIVYNFPHAGFHYPEKDDLQIKSNEELVKGFFMNAKVLLRKQGGEIHVTHKKGDPYDKWDLVKKAEKIGLVLHEKVPFNRDDYPGYYNKRGHGKDCDLSFEIGDCSTYKFRLPPQFANWNGY